jgi:glycosyltransferase involved in cell wall biosynthesis
VKHTPVGNQFGNNEKTFNSNPQIIMNPQLYNAEKIERRIESKRIGAEVISARPRVSVVIPAYNVAEFVCETLISAFNQTVQDFELILVNDGSPDSAKLEERISKTLDRIIYVKQSNGGAAAARNTAIFLARGEYIAFLDGDDIWDSSFLEKQIAELSSKNFDMIYADAMMFGSKPWAGRTFMELSPSNGEVTLLKLLLGDCNVITSGTVVKLDVVLKVGGFDEDRELSGIEDFDLWTRIAKFGYRIGYQKDVLLRYRVFAGSLSGGFVERAENGVTALRTVKNKFQLDETEQKVWTKRFALANAQVSLEKGKVSLMKENFSDARIFIKTANEFYKKFKLSAIVFLLYVCPRTVLYFLKKFRADEFAFEIGTEQSKSD